ncbi:anthrone oxygenase family protein [Actinomadura sediminis]|uniref:Anthrone oxygenase family protein n=1 Tax=Actinomadura sediminis TaxID=1038904 RepID=A0ABW3EHP6_9ACTN
MLELTLRDYGPQVYTQVRQVELVRLDDLASATLLPALIATAALIALTAGVRERRFWLVVAAFVLLVAAFLTSVTVNLPINSDQLDWSVQAPPPDWDGERDRWQVAHVVRTTAAVLAFGCLAAAALLGPPRARR